ncbi:hypothetical protein LX66_4549 [Chitinophaga japonensis]|uniref:Uncharacterized protein n=2 Tax=Chitinophaga japonensis TaxID=104662 RepID=A0A562STU4_CHIJA|nr:hypothetical protein LX66_4549 [Chitinophaga japonensis]
MRSLLAMFFMALLVFVQGVKLLHRHGDTLSKQRYAADRHAVDQRFNAAHYCAVCDYQLTKHAELPPTVESLQLLSFRYITYAFRPSTACSGAAQAPAGRGPPTTCIA